MLRYSKYNHMVKLPGEEAFVLANFRTGAVTRLSPFQKDVFEQMEGLPETSTLIRDFLRGGFLVNHDEMRHMRTRAFQYSGCDTQMSLTVCPTLACNFACPYCFETPRFGCMSRETQDAIANFVETEMKVFRLNSLQVICYGGEPLLYPEIIKSLSEKLMEVCRHCGAKYDKAHIITNGWFLTEENAALLKRANVRRMQITLDGPTPETNDGSRRERGGGSSFRRIMENLKNLRSLKKDEESPFVISVRCNVNKQNAHLFGTLKEKIAGIAEETGIAMDAYPAIMSCDSGSPQSVKDSVLSGEEFANLADWDALSGKRDRGHYRGTYCQSQQLNCYVIDELGNLYKCSETVGCEEFSIGNVRNYGSVKEPNEKIAMEDRFFETVFPEDDAECMACKVFPLCMGGCPRMRILKGRKCLPVKSNPDGYVLARYRAKVKDGR